MAKESQADQAGSTPPNIQDRIAQRETALEKLREEYKAKPTDKLARELKRKHDTILHLRNIAKGDPRERARRAAQTARSITLDRAIK